MDNNLCVAAYFLTPVNEPFPVSLNILLVFQRHMLLDRAVLVESPVQSRVGADPVSTIEHLYCGSGKPYIHFLLDVFKGNGIVHALYRNVVIGSHCCHLPCC